MLNRQQRMARSLMVEHFRELSWDEGCFDAAVDSDVH